MLPLTALNTAGHHFSPPPPSLSLSLSFSAGPASNNLQPAVRWRPTSFRTNNTPHCHLCKRPWSSAFDGGSRSPTWASPGSQWKPHRATSGCRAPWCQRSAGAHWSWSRRQLATWRGSDEARWAGVSCLGLRPCEWNISRSSPPSGRHRGLWSLVFKTLRWFLWNSLK